MRLLTRIAGALHALVRRSRIERELDEELREYLRASADAKIASGMSPDAAARAARVELGSVEAIKDQVRDTGWESTVETFWQDVRHGARLLRRHPLFTCTAALSLAVGLGATTTIFTIANALLLRPAPGVADPAGLVDIARAPRGRAGLVLSSYADYLDLRARTRTLADVYAYQLEVEPMSLRSASDAGAERVFVSFVSANYFAVLGVSPLAGRLIDEAGPAREAPSIVLGHRLWTQRFDADPAIVGRTLQVNGHAFIVAGVAHPEFRGTSVVAPDLWLPIDAAEALVPESGRLTSRRTAWLMLGGRLQPGVRIPRAAAEVEAIGRALERESSAGDPFSDFRVAAASPIPVPLRGAAAGFVALLMIVVSLVLLIACANVAGVLLARAVARRREMAVRLAIGAGRARLVRQLLTETTLLFVLGGAMGILLARGMTTLLIAALPAFPVSVSVSLPLDGRVIAFSAAVSFAAALLSGIAPALHASRADVISALKDQSQGPSDRLRLRSAFVVAQIAFSVLLVIAAGLFVRTLERVGSVDRGFDPRGVELATLDLSMAGYTDVTGPVFVRELADRVRALPGVEAAGVATTLPSGGQRRRHVRKGTADASDPSTANARDLAAAEWNSVEPGTSRCSGSR